MYAQGDIGRESGRETDADDWRHPFSLDYSRVVHSPSLRRLQGKTQVFPVYESDFFRNRLTHSLEVAQVAQGIAERLNAVAPELRALPPEGKINTRLCEAAALIHDLGHPPFGHNGEQALDTRMRSFGGFEGNAQSLRIISRLEKGYKAADGTRLGLDLCYRTLASALKYDSPIPYTRRPEETKPHKGYYNTERYLVGMIKAAVVGDDRQVAKFQTIECSIMDAADDVAYSTYDLEDCLKAGFLTPAGILTSDERLPDLVAQRVGTQLGKKLSPNRVVEVFRDVFEGTPKQTSLSVDSLRDFAVRYRAYDAIAENGYFRTTLSTQLVDEAITSCTLHYNREIPALSTVSLSADVRERVEILKQYTFAATIYSSRVKVAEYRGYEVVTGIFDALAGPRGEVLMPDDVRELYEKTQGDYGQQMRIVSDFVAGMTDRYAMEFYGRLHSDTAQSMFKPL